MLVVTINFEKHTDTVTMSLESYKQLIIDWHRIRKTFPHQRANEPTKGYACQAAFWYGPHWVEQAGMIDLDLRGVISIICCDKPNEANRPTPVQPVQQIEGEGQPDPVSPLPA